MENIGREPRRVHGTVHGPALGCTSVTSTYELSAGAFATVFTFTRGVESGAIRW